MAAKRLSTGKTIKLYRPRSSYGQPLGYAAGLLLGAIVLLLLVARFRALGIEGFLAREFLLPLLIYFGFATIIVMVIRVFNRTTYLLISDEGIEFSSGGSVVSGYWENVETFVERPMPYLLLRSADRSPLRYLISHDPDAERRIPLYLFAYSPHSELARDLRRYLPHLFSQQ